MFLGYSLKHKGYKFFDPQTSISLDVQFEESVFPFQSIHQPSPFLNQNSALWAISIPVLQSIPQPEPSSAMFPMLVQHNDIPPSPITSALSPTTQHSVPSPSPVTLLAQPTCTEPTNHAPTHHHMITKSKDLISKPKTNTNDTNRYPLPKALIDDLNVCDAKPTCYSSTTKSPEWCGVMNVEFEALLKNGTWSLVPSNAAQNIIGENRCFASKAKQMVKLIQSQTDGQGIPTTSWNLLLRDI